MMELSYFAFWGITVIAFRVPHFIFGDFGPIDEENVPREPTAFRINFLVKR